MARAVPYSPLATYTIIPLTSSLSEDEYSIKAVVDNPIQLGKVSTFESFSFKIACTGLFGSGHSVNDRVDNFGKQPCLLGRLSCKETSTARQLPNSFPGRGRLPRRPACHATSLGGPSFRGMAIGKVSSPFLDHHFIQLNEIQSSPSNSMPLDQKSRLL